MTFDETWSHLQALVWVFKGDLVATIAEKKKKILICFDCENGLQMHRNSV